MTHWWLVVSSEAAVQRPAATIRTARYREAEVIEKPRLHWQAKHCSLHQMPGNIAADEGVVEGE
jgi:hypothetical protein